MAKITVWSKQHENVWKVLQETGRYTVKREYIIKDLKEHSELVLDTYEWLVKNGPDYGNKPADVEFPVWVSFRQDATMLPEKGRVSLELEIEESLITRVNFTKWGMILNYSYIPADKADEKRHKELLEAYGVSDTQAYMSQFYPEIKREIRESWKRLFDDDIQIGSDGCYGNIWEVRREWVKNVIQ